MNETRKIKKDHQVRVPNEPLPLVTTRNEPLPNERTETSETDNDNDYESVYVYESESESESEIGSVYEDEKTLNISKADDNINSKSEISFTFEQIEVIAHAIDEETGGEYPYDSRLVERFYEINNDRGWCGSDGQPIADIVRWYKQFLDYELSNGYRIKDIAML